MGNLKSREKYHAIIWKIRVSVSVISGSNCQKTEEKKSDLTLLMLVETRPSKLQTRSSGIVLRASIRAS